MKDEKISTHKKIKQLKDVSEYQKAIIKELHVIMMEMKNVDQGKPLDKYQHQFKTRLAEYFNDMAQRQKVHMRMYIEASARLTNLTLISAKREQIKSLNSMTTGDDKIVVDDYFNSKNLETINLEAKQVIEQVILTEDLSKKIEHIQNFSKKNNVVFHKSFLPQLKDLASESKELTSEASECIGRISILNMQIVKLKKLLDLDLEATIKNKPLNIIIETQSAESTSTLDLERKLLFSSRILQDRAMPFLEANNELNKAADTLIAGMFNSIANKELLQGNKSELITQSTADIINKTSELAGAAANFLSGVSKGWDTYKNEILSNVGYLQGIVFSLTPIIAPIVCMVFGIREILTGNIEQQHLKDLQEKLPNIGDEIVKLRDMKHNLKEVGKNSGLGKNIYQV